MNTNCVCCNKPVVAQERAALFFDSSAKHRGTLEGSIFHSDTFEGTLDLTHDEPSSAILVHETCLETVPTDERFFEALIWSCKHPEWRVGR